MVATATPPSTSPVSEARRSVFIDREAPALRQGRLHAYSLNRWAALAFDYQFIDNPGYNADRGPVSVFSQF
jgi:hypothetical protein